MGVRLRRRPAIPKHINTPLTHQPVSWLDAIAVAGRHTNGGQARSPLHNTLHTLHTIKDRGQAWDDMHLRSHPDRENLGFILSNGPASHLVSNDKLSAHDHHRWRVGSLPESIPSSSPCYSHLLLSPPLSSSPLCSLSSLPALFRCLKCWKPLPWVERSRSRLCRVLAPS